MISQGLTCIIYNVHAKFNLARGSIANPPLREHTLMRRSVIFAVKSKGIQYVSLRS